MIRIIIGDDHELIRNGFARLLQAEPDMKLVGEAGTAEALFPLMESTRADVLVLDIELPDMNGLEILKNMKSRGITLKTLVMSMHPEGRYAKRALQNGAAGYITKDSASEELVSAIRKIHASGRYISPSLAEEISLEILEKKRGPVHESLSDREYQLLLLLGKGKNAREAAEVLNISINTVNSYRKRVMTKMGFHGNADCIMYVMNNHLNG